MYTMKIQTWKENAEEKDFPKTLYIEGRRITNLKFWRTSSGKDTDESLSNFCGRIRDETGVGDNEQYNPSETAHAAASFSYFNEKGEYGAISIYNPARIYLMNEVGKTVDKIIV